MHVRNAPQSKTPKARGLARRPLAVAVLSVLTTLLAACGTSVDPAVEPEGIIFAAIDSVGEDGGAVDLNGTSVTGVLHLVVEVKRSVDRIAFHLDGADAPLAVDEEAPYEMHLDTTTLAEGEHEITAVAPHPNGKRTRVEARATFVVANDAPSESDGDAGASDGSDTGDVGDGGDGDTTTGGDGVRTALLVVGDASRVGANDAAIRERLEVEHRLTVDVVDDELVTTAQADGYDLVVQSKSGDSTSIGTRLKASTAPLLTGEDNAQMVSQLAFIADDGGNGTYWHYVDDALHLQNGDAPAELTAGLSGSVTVYEGGDQDISYADSGSGLAPDAIRIAEFGLGGPSSDQWSMYAFEKGATLADGSAAQGRRVFNGTLYDDTFAALSAAGLALFDAQVTWLLGGAALDGTDASEPAPTGDSGETDPSVSDVSYDGPLVIRSGGTYSGNWASDDHDVAAVTVLTSEPVVIENANLRGAGNLISAPWTDAHLTVRNVHGDGLAPTVAGEYGGRFLHAEGYRYVRVENSYLDGTSGIYLNDSHPGATVQILRNRARNLDGRVSDGQGGYQGVHYVQFVQFNKGNGLAASEVAWNEVVNEPYESVVEDIVSTYRTSGREGDPLRIHDNYFQGAYPMDPRNDGYSGGGIILGDEGGAYLHAYDNHVVATTNYGVSIAGGHDNRLYGNRVVSCGRLPDGGLIAAQNVGIYIWNYSGSSDWGANVGYDNGAAWTGPDGRNDWWIPDATDWSGNVRLLESGETVSCDMERAEHHVWLEKVDAQGASLGLLPGR